MRWNVSQAARACGVSDESWRNWERGHSPRNEVAVARQIAEATGCSIEWLLGLPTHGTGSDLNNRGFHDLIPGYHQPQLLDAA